MIDEKKLNEQMQIYSKLAQQDKKIDVASLMINALNQTQTNLLEPKQKRWGYLVSIAFPPFGLLFALKFWMSTKDDGHDAAWMCITLTAVGLLFMVIMTKLLISGSGVSNQQLQQIQQIKPKDIQELYQ